jgi:hypothetical protein
LTLVAALTWLHLPFGSRSTAAWRPIKLLLLLLLCELLLCELLLCAWVQGWPR